MSLAAVLALGFFLGMRHATDADHVVAVSTIVTRERSLRAALPIGVLWGVGHTITILLVGGAIALFGIVIPPRLGLGMEFSVALMLVLLGAMTVHGILRDSRGLAVAQGTRPGEPGSHHGAQALGVGHGLSLRPLVVGIVHGLAGSAAVALLVLATVREISWALGYLLVFGAGTIAGMLLVTLALAVPLAVAARRFERLHRALAVAAGVAGIAFGAFLVYEVGFVGGLFTAHPTWTPH